MKEDQELKPRESFLINFIEALIENFPRDKIQEEIPEKNTISAPSLRTIGPINIIGQIPAQIQPAQLKFETKETPSPASQHIASPFVEPQAEAQFPTITRQRRPPIKLAPFAPQTQRVLQPQQNSPLIRLFPLLHDPSITSIECPGPEKNIVVHQLGAVKVLPLILTQKEIEDIMQEFSRRTKIPLIKGVFKAAIDNYVVSAVLSEFIGTRFYIEKMHQMNALMPQQRIF